MKYDKRNITDMVAGMVIGATLVSEAAAGTVAATKWPTINVYGRTVYTTADNSAGDK